MTAETISKFRKELESIISRYYTLRRVKGKILAFPSGKGGVGKTTIVVNLASALALRGQRVLVMDLNFALPNVHMYLDERPAGTLTHYLNGEVEIDEIVGRVVLKDAEFFIIPTESVVDFQKKINVDKINGTIDYFRSRFDYILLDLAPGLSKYVVYPLRLSDHIFIVSADVKPAYIDAMRVLKLVSAIGGSHEGFIINLAESEELTYFKHMGVFAIVPYDEHLKKASQMGKTIFHMRFSGFLSPSRKVFTKMADEILTRLKTGNGQ